MKGTINPAALSALMSDDVENFLAASTPGGIERQEKAGQDSFIEAQTLPKDCPKEDLEKIGFVFGDDVDDIFVEVKYPDGWRKVPTDHSMWNDLVDDKGRNRGAIFYKAAFYDRSSHMRLSPRYSFMMDYAIDSAIQYNVTDCGESIFKTKKVECVPYSDEYWEAEKVAEKECVEYLEANLPEWKSPLAYWG